MFRALDARSDSPVILLDDEWQQNIEPLRRLGRAGHLVCPGCREPVHVRAGDVRRWHFAHKHLDNCPLGRESEAIAASKAILYPWLKEKYGNALIFEHDAGLDLPRPVDLFIETKKGNATFWLIDKQLKPDDRELLPSEISTIADHQQWLFTEEMLDTAEEERDLVDLTTTEREFRSKRKYDWPYGGKSLQYLRREQPSIRTYRSLHCVHRPQRFAGIVVEHALSDMLIHHSTGELVHSGDQERYNEFYAEWRKRQEQEKEREETLQNRQVNRDACQKRDEQTQLFRPPPRPPEPVNKTRESSRPRVRESSPAYSDDVMRPGWANVPGPGGQIIVGEEHAADDETLMCRACGHDVQDWSVKYGQTGECKCRSCVRS